MSTDGRSQSVVGVSVGGKMQREPPTLPLHPSQHSSQSVISLREALIMLQSSSLKSCQSGFGPSSTQQCERGAHAVTSYQPYFNKENKAAGV